VRERGVLIRLLSDPVEEIQRRRGWECQSFTDGSRRDTHV
ncbi:hypothetical protein GCK32_010841, partial [Trichostrongylus colubriformis]